MNLSAARFLPSPGGEPIGMGLAASVLMHVALAAVIVFWPAGGFDRPDIFVPNYNVRLVGAPAPAPPAPPAKAQPAPVAKAQPKPLPKPAAKPKPSPKPKEAIAIKKDAVKPKRVKPKKDVAKANQNLLDKRLARIKAQVATERRVDSAIDRLEQRVAGRGDVKKAAPVTGAGTGGGKRASSVLQAYQQGIQDRVNDHWILPATNDKSSRGLLAVLVVRIRRDGSLERVWVERSSGNSRFDQSALRAVRRASPFPRLPVTLRESTLEVGLRFSPEDINT